ncbi:circularly permutated Ras protein 1-like isoform X1 [Micropterus salmoides]|uniref:circularly permutated Ras protein 1-like isoform X1 n=1 Tax=Micropterus salmoides TaxID=27706 RepID=UPI0018ED0D5D|nr:circularly permutated Ras protein 1-like isoform X1 [Micropterus salmoides]XP_038591765.1 circularly permutated Ras protein 1-like isoform X1 [Micropterus salmoides]XP_038591766.1 circularly permutated Ras protein 1-like isoform X1 [Micropterus salmoides]XP_038591767.1 circularly permutated Ras protein 1-like isoform X1 [Micropterus salmoides]
MLNAQRFSLLLTGSVLALPPPLLQQLLQKSNHPPPKIIEQLEKSKEVKKAAKVISFYENAEFHSRTDAVSSTWITPQQTAPPRKTALLPPHMRPAANSQSLPYSQPLNSPNPNSQTFIYDLPKSEPNLNGHPWDQDYSYTIPEGTGVQVKLPGEASSMSAQTSASAPALPPRPSFMKLIPDYLVLLPSTHSSPSSSQKSLSDLPHVPSPTSKASADKGLLPGNPNVVLISLGKLLSQERVQAIDGQPVSCSQCGAVLDSSYCNMVKVCYFCQHCESASSTSMPQCFPSGYQDSLFLLNPDEQPLCAADALLLFCIDISGSMSITSQVSEGEHTIHRSRLQLVQEAVLLCVQRLSEQQPDKRVGLITFNQQVTMHGYENFKTQFLSGDVLTDIDYLKRAAASFPIPPPLSQTKDHLKRQVMGLCESGTTALGPAALLTIAMASRQPGSKVIICTDGKANTKLGDLEEEDIDARTLLSSTIFYQELGEYAASQGVTVYVLSIEGTDCRLDELGRLADRTGGKVVIACPVRLHAEFEQIIENRTIATHCSVTLLLPQSLTMRGEREAGHKGTREVGNVDPDKEITFQFGANVKDKEGKRRNVSALASGSCVSIQLQIRYRQMDGQTMLRVITANRDVTDDSSAVLSSLSLAIIQLNSSQACAALAVRGRFVDARTEGEQQRKLIERAIEHNHSAEDEEIYQDWVKTMEPIYNNINNFTRRKTVISDSQPLTDAGAALLYNMKHSNRKSISQKNKCLGASTFYLV